MEHSFLDKYSERDSFLHRLDPRTKIISLLGFIILIVLTPPAEFIIFAQYGLIILALIAISRLPLLFILKRALLVIPFALMITIFIPFLKSGRTAFTLDLHLVNLRVTYEGLIICWNVLVKSVSSVLLLTLLISTTRFSTLLKGLEYLKVPRVLIILVSFMYRYLFVMIDEAEHMQRARTARWFGGYIIRQIRVIGNMVALLFIRTYERSERIYTAMLARGFDGRIRLMHKLKLNRRDAGFVIIMLLLIIVIWRKYL
jgi:cobalt/nickel transport system permease protein